MLLNHQLANSLILDIDFHEIFDWGQNGKNNKNQLFIYFDVLKIMSSSVLLVIRKFS